MRKLLSVFLITILILGPLLPAGAADKKATGEEKAREIEKAIFMAAGVQDRVLKIGLVDCIAYALKNNSEILIKRIEPKLKEDDVKIAKADFEPTFSADVSLADSKERPTSSLAVSETRTTEFDVGMDGKLIAGTQYSLDFLNQRYKSNSALQNPNPYYKANPAITITQPLFRDFGVLVNTADITIARNNKRQSQEGFRDTVMETISKTKVSFYTYMYYLENYAIAQSSLVRAKDLLEINKARYDKGLASSVDLLETETAMAQRDKSLISAESNLKKAEDDLKLITNLVDDPETWNAKLELLDDKPQFKEEKVALLESLQNAFEFRPDYKSVKIDLKNRDIKIATAKNALLPTVDLVTSFGLNGLGSDYQEALEKTDSNYKDWSVGFKVSVPWGGAEHAKFDQRNLEKAQSLLSFKRLEQKIILEVRDKVREVDIQARQVKAAKLNLETEEKNYAAQKERYAAGQVSTHDMLDYQDKLAQAELDYVKALIDYNIALINLDKSQGLTLVKNDIKLEE
jgi:outer membrane protein TolC